jgi:hypothetical protein
VAECPDLRRWDVTVSGSFDYYRYKVVAAATGDCRDFRNYGTPRRVTDFPSIDDRLPPGEVYQFLYVVGGTRTLWGVGWQGLEHPAIVVARTTRDRHAFRPGLILANQIFRGP